MDKGKGGRETGRQGTGGIKIRKKLFVDIKRLYVLKRQDANPEFLSQFIAVQLRTRKSMKY
jgi:hypothetical protein